MTITAMIVMTACIWSASGCSSRREGAPATGGGPGRSGDGGGVSPAVVLFLVDGLTPAALDTAVSAGATHFAFVLANGVRVLTAHSTSPAAVIQLPDGSPGGTQPWGHATSGNVAVHTGCHLFESSQMDDIFLAAREAGIRSVFSGGDANYAVFTTADFHYGTMMDDATTVERAITHLQKDGARLLRIHLQRVRDSWTGPQSATDPGSPYVAHLLEVDGLLGRLIDALATAGVWDDTYLVVAAFDGFSQAGGQIAGAHKLAPTVSPGKTVEGLLIGAAGAIVCSLLLRRAVSLGTASALALAAIASVAPDSTDAPKLRAPATPEAILDALTVGAEEAAPVN